MKIVNKKAKYDYFLSDNLEVGMVLRGPEVKSILNNHISLKESYVKIIKDEMWLINANISEIKTHGFEKECDGLRPKKLLLHKKQIQKYQKLLKESGTTLILYEIYTDDKGKIKGTLCLAKGKKLYDKREAIKERDLLRSLR